MIKCIDDNVGRILAHLRKSGLIDQTIIVFTSDHGDMRGEHHRHNKGTPLEASAKVPFIIYYPDKIKAGTTVKQALNTTDFLPTILGLMGVETAGEEDGRDASSLFTGGSVPAGWKDITFARGGAGGQWLAAITPRYKLVLSATDPPWLIDMERDPDELENFCADPAYRDTVRTLANELLAYGRTFHDERIEDPKFAGDLRDLTK
jgi:uncharacterized sulfatase